MIETRSTPLTPLVEAITAQLKTLSAEELHTIQEFVGYLRWKRQAGTDGTPAPKKSAEARAIERIKDLDDPTQWITVVEADQEIDVEARHQRLRERGLSVATPNDTL